MTKSTLHENTVFLALELGNKKYKLAFMFNGKKRRVSVAARDTEAFINAIEQARVKMKWPNNVEIKSCYEAGRDGFWLHRFLESQGINNIVVDAASIETNRRAKKTKTDKVDLDLILRKLIDYYSGDKNVWSVLRIPSKEDEDERRPHRCLDRLKHEQKSLKNRIRSTLVTHGLDLPHWKNFPEWLDQVKTFDGEELPSMTKKELLYEYRRLELVEEQIKEILQTQQEKIQNPSTEKEKMINMLVQLRAIGQQGAWKLVLELLGWREFNNRRELGAAAGLVCVPHNSGDLERELGISKSGNKRIRTLLVEMAWSWIRYQPKSTLTLWFNERFANNGKKMRKKGIVALARKLLIALWRYLTQGVVPEGAICS